MDDILDWDDIWDEVTSVLSSISWDVRQDEESFYIEMKNAVEDVVESRIVDVIDKYQQSRSVQ